MRYEFGEYVLDSELLELTKNGKAISLEPQVFRLLFYLLENRSRVISKEELIHEIWDGRIVSDAAMHSRINAARAAIGDTGKAQTKIKTYSKRGIRFIAPITRLETGSSEFSQSDGQEPSQGSEVGVTQSPPPDMPSLYTTSSLQQETTLQGERGVDSIRHRKHTLLFAGLFLVALVGLALTAGFALYGSSTPEYARSGTISFPLKLAVLPFENLSDDPNQTYFGEGLADDLITDLARFQDLELTPRHSSFRYRGEEVTTATIASELSVRLIVEGSVRRFGEDIRINAKVLDPFENTVIWAERYDGSVDDIFKFQTAMLRGITSSIGLPSDTRDLDQSRHRGTEDVAAYDAYLRGMGFIAERRVLDVENIDAAEAAFGEAIMIDRNYALAHAGLAWTKWLRSESIFHAKGLEDVAFDLANRSLELQENALAHRTLAKKYFSTLTSFIQFNRDPKAALLHLERARELEPENPDVLADLGSVLPFVGRAPEALEVYRKAVELNPNPPGWYKGASTLGYLFTGQLNDALREANLWIGGVPKQAPPYLFKSAILGLMGKKDEAYNAYNMFDEMQGNANYSIYYINRKWPMEIKEKEMFIKGLKAAGVK